MTFSIRNLYPEEFDTFMRFLGRCYGATPGTFERLYPHLYRPTPELCASAHVLEREGEIVSHVGLFPIDAVVYGMPIPIGGIGAVATAPSERGKGYMSKLLYHVIDVMRAQGYVLSWLGGDRQRYNTFGWEQAGVVYELTFSRRSLNRAGVEPVPVEGQFPADAVDVIERYQSLPAYHARRPNLELQLQKEGLQVWTAEDGYVIASRPGFRQLSIVEVVSASGREAGMVRAVLNWTDREQVSWLVPAWDSERLARLMPGVTGWHAGGWQMYRIVNLTKLLAGAQPTLTRRASTLRDFELSIGVREHDRTDVATVSVCGGSVEISPGRNAARYTEWSSVEAARLLLGGPPIAAETEIPADLAPLLPIPVCVPRLDDV